MTTPTPESHPSTEPLLAICLFAAFADGDKSESERSHIESLAREFGDVELSAISRRILMGRLSLESATGELSSQADRMLAYEMARAVCEAGGGISSDEERFLGDLRTRLHLGTSDAAPIEAEVDSVVLSPVAGADEPNTEPAVADQGAMILRYAILNGALELLPETLATMAIIPLQMKMVWRIGKAHGCDLDRSSIKEFLATAGIGMGSQMVEGFARKLMTGLGKKIGGKLVGRVAGEAAGSAFSFASTYAIGHLAVKYYAAGRTLGASQLKALYEPLARQAKDLHTRHLPEIQQRAQSLDTTSILNLVRGKAAV